ncbi:MAG: single-stranded DNA-binding protein [Chlorobi bacterium]|nr:single-stranded DNA-binding protein [Chlorobiota bacterium]
MAQSINRVTLLGNLGRDPELRSTPSGQSVCSVSIATTDSYKDKTSGEWVDSTEWHNLVFWAYNADKAAQYLKKGSRVCIEGKLKTRNYEKDGVTRYFTEVHVLSMVLLDKRDSTEAPGEHTGNTGSDSPTAAPDLSADDGDIPF